MKRNPTPARQRPIADSHAHREATRKIREADLTRNRSRFAMSPRNELPSQKRMRTMQTLANRPELAVCVQDIDHADGNGRPRKWSRCWRKGDRLVFDYCDGSRASTLVIFDEDDADGARTIERCRGGSNG